MKKLLISLVLSLLASSCASRYVPSMKAWKADSYCYTTVQGIQIHAYEMKCPTQGKVEALTQELYARVGAWQGILDGAKVTFIPKPLDKCGDAVSGRPVESQPGQVWIIRGCADPTQKALVWKHWDWTYTYVHELGHLMLAKQGLSDPLDRDNSLLNAIITSRNHDFYLLEFTPWHGAFQSRKPL